MEGMTLREARALAAQEDAADKLHLWEAILAINDVLLAENLQGLPSVHIERAQAATLRAGSKDAGDYTDTELRAITVTSGARLWAEITGLIYKNEFVIASDGTFYITLHQHYKRDDLEPGTDGGRTLFRPVREEPTDGGILDFIWGELVPFGAQRRDPVDGKIYTPISPQGVTLYEPHYPHLVPSEYKLVENVGGNEEGTIPRWADLEDGHIFNVDDAFSDYAKTYEVLRQFAKQADYRPPALIDDYYRLVE